jgi:hypothetical protein
VSFPAAAYLFGFRHSGQQLPVRFRRPAERINRGDPVFHADDLEPRRAASFQFPASRRRDCQPHLVDGCGDGGIAALLDAQQVTALVWCKHGGDDSTVLKFATLSNNTNRKMPFKWRPLPRCTGINSPNRWVPAMVGTSPAPPGFAQPSCPLC